MIHITSKKGNSSPRAIHLVEFLYQGGIERFLFDFSRLVPERDLKQIFFAYEMEDFSGVAAELKGMNKDVRIHKKKGGRDFGLLRKLNAIVREERIDVVHTHDFGPMEYAFMLKLLNPRLTLVHTQHTLHHFICHKKYLLFFQMVSYFYKSIVAVSGHVKDVIKKECRYMKKTPVVVHNGVDLEKFHGLKPGIFKGGELRLVAVSRISKEKNLIHLLKTCKLLKEKEIPFQLHHAGSGAGPDLETITEYVRQNGLERHVTLHGHQEDIRTVLRLGEIFVSSSLTEGHPIAVLEAMASRLLCVCSDIPAHKSISPGGIVLFDLNKEDGLFQTLLKMKKGGPAALKRIDTAQKDVGDRYTAQKMVLAYLDLYN